MKAKKNPAVKKVVQEAPSNKLAEELAQKEQIILNLTQELQNCLKLNTELQFQLTQYQQQPLPTLYHFYRDAGFNYYNNHLVLPLNRHYEDLTAQGRKILAETLNQIQAKIQSAQHWITQLQQQLLDYLGLGQQLYRQNLNALSQQKNQLLHNSQLELRQLQARINDFLHLLSQKLPFLVPKATFAGAEVSAV